MAELSEKDILLYENYLTNQFSNALKLRKFLELFLQQAQELEDANNLLNDLSTDITVATGYQLDIIGKLVGAERKGKGDEEYREEIYFRISLNIGNGTPEDCIQYLAYVTKATNVKLWSHYPAEIIMETNGSSIPNNIPNTLDNITLAGVSVGGVIVVPENREVFIAIDSDRAYTNLTPSGYLPVTDDDELSRSILPDFTFPSNQYFGFLGNILAGAFGTVEDENVGEPFISVFEYPDVDSTKGIFTDVYTKI